MEFNNPKFKVELFKILFCLNCQKVDFDPSDFYKNRP